MRFLSVLASLLLAAPLSAQTHPPTMPIVVEADRVKIGPEFLPRCMPGPLSLIIPTGQTVTAAVGNALYDCVEVGGTLRVSRTDDTVLRFTTLYILPGGTLDVGTADDPIACNRRVEFIVRNVPIAAADLFQWGNGLVNFGAQTRVGCPKTSFLEAAGSLAAGATSITLASVPDNWAPGDELLIPDTDKPEIVGNGLELTAVPSRREPRIEIASIAGDMVTLKSPLTFAHLTIADPQGVPVLRPRVANLTRNIVIRSENSATPQAGVRGHTADIGDKATWDVRYNELVQLGRTANTPLDDTVVANGVVTHQGTNQRGKYATHFHHAGSSPSSKIIGSVLRGHPLTTKWGIAVHATHDVLVAENVVVDFPGAGIVTEDGYEVRNVFDRDLMAYSMGIPGDQLGTPDDVHMKNLCPGCSGAGGWFHGVRNTFTRLEAWNNFRGVDLFNQQGNAGTYPSEPGGMPDTPFVATDNHTFQPIKFENNVTAANVNIGLEIWATRTFLDLNLISAYNSAQVAGVLSDGIDHYMVNPKLIGKVGTGSTGIIAGQAYSQGFVLEGGGQIAGNAVGIHGGGGSAGMFIKGPERFFLQNEVNIDQIPHVARFQDVLHVPLGSFPHRYITFGNVGRFSGAVWQAGDALPDVGDSDWVSQAGSRWSAEPWQDTGKNYLLLHIQQLGSNPAWYSAAGPHGQNCPEVGLTMQGCWDKYGKSWGGDVLKDAEKVVLDGIENAYGREGLGVALSPPRAVCSFPTLREPAVSHGEPNDLLVAVSCQATGDLSTASPTTYMISTDDGPALNLGDYVTFSGSDRSFNAHMAGPGLHKVKVWLTQTASPMTPLVESESTWEMCVGPACMTTVPGIRGLTVAYGTNAINSAYLKPGPTTTAPSNTVQAGALVGTVPPFGTTLPQQSPVGLVISSGPDSVPMTVAVPSVLGRTGPDAEQVVKAAGLVVGHVDNTPSPDVPFGIVLAQAPNPGTVVNIGSGVDLTVSSGPPPPPVCVPPQVLENGVCITPPPVCVPPAVLVNGVCTIPPPLGLVLPLTVMVCDSSAPPKCTVYVPKP